MLISKHVLCLLVGDLHQFLHDTQTEDPVLLPEAVVLDIFIQICAGLRHLHGHRTLHKDLKPQVIYSSGLGYKLRREWGRYSGPEVGISSQGIDTHHDSAHIQTGFMSGCWYGCDSE